MPRSSATIALYLSLVFAGGVAVGAFGFKVYAKNPEISKTKPEEWRGQYVKEMTDRLQLQPDQLEKLNAILDDTHSRFLAAREKQNAEIKALKEAHSARVRAMLTPQQLPEYNKLRAEREQRSKMRDRR
jgi:hypothetical protein